MGTGSGGRQGGFISQGEMAGNAIVGRKRTTTTHAQHQGKKKNSTYSQAPASAGPIIGQQDQTRPALQRVRGGGGAAKAGQRSALAGAGARAAALTNESRPFRNQGCALVQGLGTREHRNFTRSRPSFWGFCSKQGGKDLLQLSINVRLRVVRVVRVVSCLSGWVGGWWLVVVGWWLSAGGCGG